MIILNSAVSGSRFRRAISAIAWVAVGYKSASPNAAIASNKIPCNAGSGAIFLATDIISTLLLRGLRRQAINSSYIASPPDFFRLAIRPKLPFARRSVSSLTFASGIKRLHSSRSCVTVSGCIFSTRARERTVGKTFANWCTTSKNSVFAGGSSSNFNNAFDAATFNSSTESIKITRQSPDIDDICIFSIIARTVYTEIVLPSGLGLPSLSILREISIIKKSPTLPYTIFAIWYAIVALPMPRGPASIHTG